MIQSIRRYLAIRTYVRRLSNDLVRRFGKRKYYSTDQVKQAVQRGKFLTEFAAYAHAAFCRLEDFEKCYQASEQADDYGRLRRVISRRYLSGQFDFDAETIIHRYRMPNYILSGDMERSADDDAAGDGGGHH